MFPTGIRIPIKKLITIGTTFLEGGRSCVVTRVTDWQFDTYDKETGDVVTRDLGLWEFSWFTNQVSAVRGLLRP